MKFNRDFHDHSTRLASFIAQPLSMSLEAVPGVNRKNMKILQNAGIRTTHQLIGKYLSLSHDSREPFEVADAFERWLTELGIEEKSTVTAAVAEKIGTWIPSIYNVSDFWSYV